METSGENQKVGNTFQIKKEDQIKRFNIVCSLLSPKDQLRVCETAEACTSSCHSSLCLCLVPSLSASAHYPCIRVPLCSLKLHRDILHQKYLTACQCYLLYKPEYFYGSLFMCLRCHSRRSQTLPHCKCNAPAFPHR